MNHSVRSWGEFSGPLAPSTRSINVPQLCGVFLFTLALHFVFASSFLDYEVEAVVFKPAVDLLEGKMLYRDSFTQYGALCVLLQAGAMQLFGKHLIVVKYEMVLFYALTAVFLWLVWRRFCSPWLATGAVLVWNLMSYHFVHAFLAWASGYAVLFQSVSLYFLFLSLERKKFVYYFLTGIFAGLCIFCKQNVGVYLLCFELLVPFLLLFIRRGSGFLAALKISAQLISGALFPLSAFLLWFVGNHALKDWYLQNIKWPGIWAITFGDNLHPFFILRCLFVFPDEVNVAPCLAPWIYLGLPLLTLGLFFTLTFKLRKSLSGSAFVSVWLVAFISIASWFQYFPIAGIGHLWWSATPMFGISLFALDWLSRMDLFSVKNRIPALKRQGVAFFTLVAVFYGPVLIRQLYLGWKTRRPSTFVRIPGQGPLAGLRVSEPEARFAFSVEETIQRLVNDKYPAPKVLLDSTNGIFLTFVKNLKPFHPMWPMQYVQPISALYPDFSEKLHQYILSENPLVFAKSETAKLFEMKYPSYHVVANVQGKLFILESGKN